MAATRSWILHVDLDQFLAAVEVLRRPELRGLPVVVGGDGDPTRSRQVVATCSYEARAFGVHSGMPLRAAARRCPDAVFLPTDPPTYDAASARVMTTLRSFGWPVEVWGWDEAYVGATVVDPGELAVSIRAAVLAETQLSCSVGIGDNKLQAKIATSFGKPAGIGRLTSADWADVMYGKPTEALWGIGTKTARKLRTIDIHTVAQLAGAPREQLASTFGPTIGPWLGALGNGRGSTTITDEPWVARSKSRETTYPADLFERSTIDAQVAMMAEQLTREVTADGRIVHRVAVKVRSSSFYTRTKISKLRAPSTDPATVAAAALAVLNRFELDRPVRLLGVRVELDPPG
jgi:DNA polymerase-4